MTEPGRTNHPYLPTSGAGADRPRIIAHRGFVAPGAAYVENTRAAFAAAIEAGAQYLESDCRLTQDGIVVLAHDPDLSRVLGDPRAVDSVTLAELVALFEPLGGIMTLSGALTEFPEARFNIDVKVASAAEAAGRICAPHAHRVLLTSFDDGVRREALAAAGATIDAGSPAPMPATSAGKATTLKLLAALVLRSRTMVTRALEGIDALQLPVRQGPLRIVTPRLIAAAHANNVEVHVWTINDPEQMRALAALDVDGIVTDRTDLALAALR